jgi:hypothetical protein
MSFAESGKLIFDYLSTYLGITTGIPNKGQTTRAATPTRIISRTLAGIP